MGQRTSIGDELVIKELNRFIQKDLGAPRTNFSSALCFGGLVSSRGLD